MRKKIFIQNKERNMKHTKQNIKCQSEKEQQNKRRNEKEEKKKHTERRKETIMIDMFCL